MYTAFLVDDEPMVLEKLKRSPIFKECGFEICGVNTSPMIAVTHICALNPDVILTDLKMPEISGMEMLTQIKSNGIGSEGVIISAYGEFHEARNFFLSGGFDYLLKPISQHELTSLLTRLSKKLIRKQQDADSLPQSLSPELNILLKYLEENISEKHTLESIGQQFALNTTYICNLFSKHLNTTFSIYMTSLRMKEAGKLLRETAKSVKEIAPLCGYGDYFYFCRVFREHYRCTPTSYREGRF